MKIIVYPHDLELGGSQLNAIEIGAAVRDLGHDVIVFGRRGALNSRIDDLGLEFIEAPPPGRRPSSTTGRALVELCRERGVDIIHGYEWPPTLDGVFAARMGARVAIVSTVMSMSVPPFIPHSVPLVVGTEQIASAERAARRRRTEVLEPPVDLSFNDVHASVDVDAFRATYRLADDRLNVVSVARMAHELKLEGTLTAISAIGELSAEAPVRLVLVGDGPARDVVEARAAEVNAQYGKGTVVLTGRLDDPRPAYAAADIALGMGGSALRALAYGAPLIVQGEHGFWRTLTEHSAEGFLWTGWYGIDGGAEYGRSQLRSELIPLLNDPARRMELGAFGLQLVRDRFSLTRAADVQMDIYRRAVERPPRWGVLSEAIALGRYTSYYAQKRMRRAMGTERTDDFNSRPVALQNRGIVR